jgi:hypothetical protein
MVSEVSVHSWLALLFLGLVRQNIMEAGPGSLHDGQEAKNQERAGDRYIFPVIYLPPVRLPHPAFHHLSIMLSRSEPIKGFIH